MNTALRTQPRPLSALIMVMGLATVAVLGAVVFATLWLLRMR